MRFMIEFEILNLNINIKWVVLDILNIGEGGINLKVAVS